MDPGSLALLIPIVAIAAGAAVKVAKIVTQGRNRDGDPQTSERLAALEDEVVALRGEVDETHERLDFTERLLAQQRPGEIKPPG
jgi:hypothetical protein